MRIHLAEGSKDRGQYGLLADEFFNASLLSYAYRKAALSQFEAYWQELVRIHLATTCHEKRNDSRGVRTLMPEEKMNQSLFSYAYEDHEKEWAESWTQPTLKDSDLRPRVIIDSGAFTAWTTGKPINPKDYAAWAIDFDSRWRHQMASLEFMNLDVIGDQDATWQNQSILEGLGMKPLPIVTYGVDLKHLDRALEQYDYISLGGLVPYTRQKDKLQKWLDACFSRVMAYRKRTGILRRIHLLGVTTDWVLKKYPCYSSDSSSWVSCLRFGGGKAAGIKMLPRYKESDGAMAATIHTLRSEIRKYKKMEQEATNLWKSRGVVFND